MGIDGNNLDMATIYQMHVKQHYFDLLEAGNKSVEFRLNDAKRQCIKVGDKVRFVCQNDRSRFVVLAVSGIVASSSFDTLINKIDQTLLGGISPRQQLQELKEIYDSADVQQYGVIALILERAA